ncbi:MAG TPA: hypothetical protein VJ386_11230 [Candidatus Deferrimicrobiaceae bacterium]|nr:hypothetical protein [Candidatus Deferrimicrobiaceae bacterium]
MATKEERENSGRGSFATLVPGTALAGAIAVAMAGIGLTTSLGERKKLGFHLDGPEISRG